jgi:hypothetical protein
LCRRGQPEHARSIVLDQHVGFKREAIEHLARLWRLEVQREAALTGIVRTELRTVERAPIATERITAARLLDLDDIRP